VTMLPHYKTERAWQEAGLTRQQAKRYVDLHFMRRDTPTEDFSAAWDPRTGLWDQWAPPEDEGVSAGVTRNPADVAEACRQFGGQWGSMRQATEDLGWSPSVVKKSLAGAVAAGLLEEFKGPKGARGFRLVGRQLHLVADPDDPGPQWAPDDDEPERF